MPTLSGFVYDFKSAPLSGVTVIYQEVYGAELVTTTTGASGEFSLDYTQTPGFLFVSHERYWLEPVIADYPTGASNIVLYAGETDTFWMSGGADLTDAIVADYQDFKVLSWGQGSTTLRYPKNRNYLLYDASGRFISKTIKTDSYNAYTSEVATINFTASGASAPWIYVALPASFPYLIDRGYVTSHAQGSFTVPAPASYVFWAKDSASNMVGGFYTEDERTSFDSEAKIFKVEPGKTYNIHIDFRTPKTYYTDNTSQANALEIYPGVPIRDARQYGQSKWYKFTAEEGAVYEVILYQKTSMVENIVLNGVNYSDYAWFKAPSAGTYYIQLSYTTAFEYSLVLREIKSSTGTEL